nr:I78 family peptidase inhibitor [Stutzerimonas kunmingensis]
MTGCQTTSTAPSNSSPTESVGQCNADAVASLTGQTVTPEILERAREQSGAITARVLRPDDIVTLEYNSQRLNIYTDKDMTIERIGCG